MTARQRPRQLSLFERRRHGVTWLMDRWNKSRDTILRMLERGDIAGFRLHRTAKWEIDEDDVLEYERRLQAEVQSVIEESESRRGSIMAHKKPDTNGRKGQK